MSLADFLQELQSQDNIVYSQPPESAIHIIPPEKVCTKIIPPESSTQKPPTTIKLKINKTHVTTTVTEPEVTPSNIEVVQPTSTIVDLTKSVIKQPPPPSPTPLPRSEPVKQKEVVKSELPKEPSRQLTDEELFIKSGTESSKIEIWMEYFNKAKTSKKANPIVNRMKIGKFTITPDNKVLLLPDYDIVGKDPDDVLKDKWF